MKIIFNTILLLLAFIVSAKPAFAYLDPGTGSFIFQLIAGALLGGLFTFKNYFEKVKLFFRKFFKKREKDENSDKPEQ